MAVFTQVNPVGGTPLTLRDTLQIRGFRIEAPGVTMVAGLGGNARALSEEFGTTSALQDFDADTFVFIGDAHALDIDIVARRADKVLGGTGALTGSGTTAIVEVTAITDLFGISST
jgi:hypothetical protein